MLLLAGALLYTTVIRGVLVGYGPSSQPVNVTALNIPQGFAINIYADSVPGARSLAYSDNDIVYVSSKEAGNVYALVPNRAQSRAEETYVIASGLHKPNGLAWKDNDLYVVEPFRVLRYNNLDEQLENPPEPEVLFTDFPQEKGHEWRYAAFGPDGLLYVAIGMPCNVCEREDPYGTIIRLDVENPEAGYEIVARGIRNSVGFTWHPETDELWFTENGRDWLGDDLPGDELNYVPATSTPHYGFPYCHQGDLADPDVGAGLGCAQYAPPVQVLGPHVAALGLAFVPPSWPAPYAKGVFIAEHGSWNRQEAIGYRITFVPLNQTSSLGYEPFITGWLDNKGSWGRPVDVLFLPDASLLISDDKAGVVYRVSAQ